MQQLYTPLWRVKQGISSDFILRDLKPDGLLSNYVYCFREIKCPSLISRPVEVKIIPHLCVDLIFNRNTDPNLYIYGYSDNATTCNMGRSVDFFAVRFLPGQINHFFKLPFSEIYGNAIRLDLLIKREIHAIEEKLFSAATFAERINIMEEYLKKRFYQNEYVANNDLLSAVELIMQKKGCLKTEDISSEISKSDRYIRKLFSRHIGINPKTFMRIIRFQNIYKMLLENRNNRILDLALEHGYYDQAHFNREFKSYFGINPKKILT